MDSGRRAGSTGRLSRWPLPATGQRDFVRRAHELVQRASVWSSFRQRSRRARTGAHGCNSGLEQRCLDKCASKTTEKPAEPRTSWTPLQTVPMRTTNGADWHKAALNECKMLPLDMATPQKLHSGKAQERREPQPQKRVSAVE